MLKKPSLLLPNYSNLHCLYCSQSTPVHTSTSSPKSQRLRYSHPRKLAFRCFATVRSDIHHTGSPQDPFWPDLPLPNAVPTPYQIFRLKKDSPYSKRRFYELVKVYHPDKNDHESGSSDTSDLPGSIRMERYRLVVTAHEILSDPVKRSAYDKFGAGWNGQPDHGAPKYHWGENNDKRWSGFDTNDSPFRNATWEDWEKWYQRGKAKQEPVYFSNGGFLMLVLAAVFLGGFGQSIRVGENMFQRQVEKVHDDASKAVRQRRTESQGFGNRDERLQSFLRTRDPHGYGVTDPLEESYRKLLQQPEICMSDVINQRGHDHGQESKS
ncbi:hypothetical protein HO173_001052 [Letharia columbiana]|uniref:J domain-containing protein n=1 Tax=Letharia columbiana TaxID=112416 RepID=A0A8H6G662_9LECA|nr:uncharacterized protein HO173_001052 [Letharia columbiana]KAF6241257.1 hypothetical protein HO173_001052 [Letharia columbiana]